MAPNYICNAKRILFLLFRPPLQQEVPHQKNDDGAANRINEQIEQPPPIVDEIEQPPLIVNEDVIDNAS